jgi:hypothetical protein
MRYCFRDSTFEMSQGLFTLCVAIFWSERDIQYYIYNNWCMYVGDRDQVSHVWLLIQKNTVVSYAKQLHYTTPMLVFCVVVLCVLVGRYERFEEIFCLHLEGFSETLVSTYKSTRRYNPEDEYLHLHRRENLKSHLRPRCTIYFKWRVRDECSLPIRI